MQSQETAFLHEFRKCLPSKIKLLNNNLIEVTLYLKVKRCRKIKFWGLHTCSNLQEHRLEGVCSEMDRNYAYLGAEYNNGLTLVHRLLHPCTMFKKQKHSHHIVL